MNLRAIALERKVKRLKNDLDGAKQIIDTLNLRLSDAKEENERLKKQIDNMAFILRQNGLGLMENDD